MYADFEYYQETYSGTMEQEQAEKALSIASDHIDILTYNRIRGVGFDNLSAYRQMVVKTCCCQLADFETENAEMLNCLMNSYSLNGTSISIGGNGGNVNTINGITVLKSIYALLTNTGLTCASLGRW